MKVSQSPDFLESVANDPRVRPWIGGEGDIRAGDSWITTKAVEWDDGGVIFMPESVGVFSVHLVFARKARDVVDKCRQAADWIFAQGAQAVVAEVPVTHRHVRAVAQALGMTQRGGRWWLTATEHKERANGLG